MPAYIISFPATTLTDLGVANDKQGTVLQVNLSQEAIDSVNNQLQLLTLFPVSATPHSEKLSAHNLSSLLIEGFVVVGENIKSRLVLIVSFFIAYLEMASSLNFSH